MLNMVSIHQSTSGDPYVLVDVWVNLSECTDVYICSQPTNARHILVPLRI